MTVQPMLPATGTAPVGAAGRPGGSPSTGAGTFLAHLLEALTPGGTGLPGDRAAAGDLLGDLVPEESPAEPGEVGVPTLGLHLLGPVVAADGTPLDAPAAGPAAPGGTATADATTLVADPAVNGGAATAIPAPGAPTAGTTPGTVPGAPAATLPGSALPTGAITTLGTAAVAPAASAGDQATAPAGPAAAGTTPGAHPTVAADAGTAGGPGQGGDPQPGQAAPATAPPAGPGATEAATADPAPGTAPAAGAPVAPRGDAESPRPAPVAATLVTEAPAVSATGQLAAVRTPAGTAPAPVVSQVFDEVVRMSAAETGPTKRVTLLLQPANLGEVRITLVTRQDQLHVSLAAGDDAARTLLAGTSELRRLLESVGASDARITVREPTGSDTQQGRSDARPDAGAGRHGETPAQARGQSGNAWSRPTHATEPDLPATVGSTTRVRSAAAGLDVTM